MDIRHLEILRELRDRGSVTAVADALHLTPSAVSQQLALLQRGARAPLTQKVGRRVQLTDAGRAVAAQADVALKALAEVDVALADVSGALAPPVTVSAFHSAALALFPALFALPDTAVHCLDFDVPRDRFVTLAAEVDVVIAHRSMHTDPWPGGVHVTPLLAEPFDIALGANHPLAGKRLTGPDLAGLEWISVHENFPLSTALDVLAAEAGRPLTIAHRINDFAVCAALLPEGNLACLLPRHTGSLYPGIVMHPAPGRAPGRRIDALTRHDRLARPGVRRVLDELGRTAADLVARRTSSA